MFKKQNIDIKVAVDARKEQIANEEAWILLKKAKEIVAGRGKKFVSFRPSETNKEEILSCCLGRTGNLRAPTLKIGSRYIVGYNEDMYNKYFGQ